MKYWQKIFLASLLLFLVGLNVGIYLLYDTAYRTALETERERGFSEHGFISDSLKEDIASILSRGDQSDSAIKDLFQSYGAYYITQGVSIAIKDADSELYTNIPGMAAAPDAPGDGAQASKIAIIDKTPYLYVSGRISGTGYTLTTARSVETLQKNTDTLAMELIMGSMCISALLAIALYFILNRLTSPIQKLSNAATALAGGDYGIRADARGRDELSELARRFNGMADKIQAQISELNMETEKKQHFIDDLAHEMRTPLTAIGGYAQYLTGAAITEDERLSALCYISYESKRLSEISEKLLILARLRNGDIAAENVPMRKLFEDIHLATIQAANDHHVALHFDIKKKAWKSDGTLLYMLILNLIQNAIQACFEGGEVSISADESCIEVKDNGCGMDAQSLAHATEPFYRADKSRSRKGGGAGLGLAICKSICECLQLTLTIESIPGMGTTVKVLQNHDNSTTES